MKSPTARIGPVARRDLNGHVRWLRAEADIVLARRFAMAAIETFAKLAISPKKGPAIGSRNLRLAGLRKWRVDGFPKVLIFYTPIVDGVRIIRVTHAAQDWWSLLDVD